MSNFETAYPPELREHELKLVRKRQQAAGPHKQGQAEQVGFALSGGGIRSATFCLGLFQGLARLGLIRHIDYLSTVSGGGFFGALLGRLFTRDYIKHPQDVENLLKAGFSGSKQDFQDTKKADVLAWLRDNSRYLSPSGSGDLFIGIAVLLRNWVAVQVILMTFVLMVFIVAQLILTVATDFQPEWVERVQCWVMLWPGGENIWWSTYGILILPLIVFLVFPIGWAYWILVKNGNDEQSSIPVINRWLAWVLSLVVALIGFLFISDMLRYAFAIVGIAGVLAGIWSQVAQFIAKRNANQDTDPGSERQIYRDEFARHWISLKLKQALAITTGVFAFILIDSLGQTVYLFWISPESTIRGQIAGIITSLLAFAASARSILTLWAAKKTSTNLIRIPVIIIASVAAFLITIFVLTMINTASHALAWRMSLPVSVPPVAISIPQPFIEATTVFIRSEKDEWVATTKREKGHAGSQPSNRDLLNLVIALGIALAFSIIFGRSWPALQYSSHHPLYTSRVIRTYMGASNIRRTGPVKPIPVIYVIPGDDISVQDYYNQGEESPYSHGAPLHLINVTINETIHGRSKLQHLDRKGVGMALGPGGLSAGINHHVVFQDMHSIPGCKAHIYPTEFKSDKEMDQPYRMFDYSSCFKGDNLSIGKWTGISGAAFATGLGSHTNLALSLLSGFGNLRLGYWWNSGITTRNPQRGLARLWRWLFPVQTFLLDEFLARFRGSAQKHWFLTDGGHFENMGAYELIRRRLPLIVIVDAEADPQYSFGGLANLIRKARLDFQAEIRFLTDQELDERLDAQTRRFFGPLEHLRRGAWQEESKPNVSDTSNMHRFTCSDDPTRFSLANAALARVEYEGKAEHSWLLYIKPTMIGDEPADLIKYHIDNVDFPQQSTADQFFDEAQWESYRCLGEHIAMHIFQVPEKTSEREDLFVPSSFTLPKG